MGTDGESERHYCHSQLLPRDVGSARDAEKGHAYTGLADVYAMQATIRNGEERDALYEKSRTTATTALELDEGLAEAHTSLGWLKRLRRHRGLPSGVSRR